MIAGKQIIFTANGYWPYAIFYRVIISTQVPFCRYTLSLSQRANVYCNAMPNGLLGRLLVSCVCNIPCSFF